MQYRAVISGVEPDSIAEELGLVSGDVVCTVNGRRIADFLDYQFLTAAPQLVLRVQKQDGTLVDFEIENEGLEDLGLRFSGLLFDPPKSCANRCVFCFIDQLPPRLRDTLYFKDDDARLSFLYGNYVSMTNMLPAELDRLVEYRLSPINISVHTTNPALREKMLRNRQAGRVLDYIGRLAAGGISMNMQIVLCKGLNDGAELDRSLSDLAAYHPLAQSVSVVPVGLTAYRAGLTPLEPFSQADAQAVVDQVEAYQARFLKELGTRFVYLGDEFYLLAGRPLPSAAAYEGFPQLENGVGMEASLQEEFSAALQEEAEVVFSGRTLLATGTLAFPFIQSLTERAKARYPGLNAEVKALRNRLFGGGVTVAGLLGGRDLLSQLAGLSFDRLLISRSMLKADEAVFLDDVTLTELETALGVPVLPVQNDGYDFLEKLLGAAQS